MIFYESPYRLLKTLQQFAEYFGPTRQVCVCREISKLHEECVRGTLEEVIAHFVSTEPRGEIVIVLAGTGQQKPEKEKNQSKNKYKIL
jgi:16S rRNA (cytidine1402-2'-O)-methyltransferase